MKEEAGVVHLGGVLRSTCICRGVGGLKCRDLEDMTNHIRMQMFKEARVNVRCSDGYMYGAVMVHVRCSDGYMYGAVMGTCMVQ